jgi:hypothetical protein
VRKAINLKMVIGTAVPLLLVIASILFYVKAVQPVKNETILKSNELKTEKQLAKIYQLEKNEAASKEQGNIEKNLPRNSDLTAFLNDLDGIEKASGISIRDLTFGQPEPEKAKSGLEKIDIQLKAESTTMKEMNAFLKRLEQSPHALIIHRLSLADQNHAISANCSIALYYYKE